MAITLLRTLTEKSRLGFGKYYYATVADLLAIHHTYYLISIYYTQANITFKDSILERLGISERIKKPGKKPELAVAKKSIYEILRENREKKKKGIKHPPNYKWRRRKKITRGEMAWKNQGHY